MNAAKNFLNGSQKIYEFTLQANAVESTSPSGFSGTPS
jgi:hypothetical protein